MLEQKTIDFSREAVVEQQSAAAVSMLATVPAARRSVSLSTQHYDGANQLIRSRARAPYLLVSSEKLTPELQVTVDGCRVKPHAVNGLFFAIEVPAGEHAIAVKRRLGGGWWSVSLLSATILGIIAWRQRRQL
ncbi:MAG TPA: hypothetical protein VNM92_08190 [Thermoanaerobaculia bacterium]|nr:hypothetical protein [Thermoanaerobaculia bacterium]